MEVKLKYRGREVKASEIAFIQALIAAHPEASRRALSQKLCEAWHWVNSSSVPGIFRHVRLSEKIVSDQTLLS